jgi:hypothetical protein
MKIAMLVILAMGCGGRASSPAPPPSGAAGFPAARWVPATPTYVFSSQTLGDAQHSLRDAIDVLGTVAGYDLGDAAHGVEDLLGIDALDADPLAAIGVDLHASWAMFSDALNPTLVVRLAAPDHMRAFLDRQRARGLVTRSVIDNTEVSSATLAGGVRISWAIDGDWMWVHFALPFAPEDDTRWFTASHGPHEDAWSSNWAWAQHAAGAAAGLVGVLDLHGTIARAVARIPDAVACAKLVEPVGRVAMAVEGDDHHVVTRIAIDVGSTAGIRSMFLPAPAGWDAVAAHAAIAAQWNLDITALRSWLAPCLATAGSRLTLFDETSVRAARGMVLDFDPGSMSGSGAVALDLTNAAYIEHQLDQIPLRRTLSRARTFGAYHGVSISIPFSVTIEYVLDPRWVIAALGEGLLAKLVTPGPPGGGAGAPPLIALDVVPPAMSAEAWGVALHMLAEQSFSGSPGPATRAWVERLMRWRDVHLAVTAEATALVVTASANRR